MNPRYMTVDRIMHPKMIHIGYELLIYRYLSCARGWENTTTKIQKQIKLWNVLVSNGILYEIIGMIYFIIVQSCVHKKSNTLWPGGRTSSFARSTTSLSSLCKGMWMYWASEMPVMYILSSVFLRLSQFSQWFSRNTRSSMYPAYPFTLWCLWEYV